MHRIIGYLFLAALWVALISNSSQAAWSWGEKPLVTIDGKSYTAQDFREWWQYYRDEDSSLPETVEPFVDWQLLVNEAERMELYREPTYKRKVQVFLKVRSLMMLKNEEIDAGFQATPDQIKAHYEKEYTPQSHVEILYFNDAQLADQASMALRSGQANMEKYKEKSAIHGSEVYFQEQLLRPKKVNAEWLDTVKAMKVGDISRPLPWKEGYVVFRLLSMVWFDEADFAAHRDKVERELRKMHENTVTARLVSDLKEKYHVQVDDELFAALDLYDLNGEYDDAVLIATDKGNITVRQFVEQARRQNRFSRNFDSSKEQMDKLKQRVLNGMLSQTLTSWAALDRHYEEESPLREVYKYYVRHRLIKELERLVFMADGGVAAEEVEAYYLQHKDEFTQPEKVRIAVMQYSGESIDRIWGEIITGGDFAKIAEKYTGLPLMEKQQSVEELSPAIKEAVAGLSIGEVASPFLDNGHWLLVRLAARNNKKVEPLGAVSVRISEKLRQEKFEQARLTFLTLLKSKVSIKINDSAWQSLQAELGD